MKRNNLTAAQNRMLNRLSGDFAMQRIAIGGNQKRTALILEQLGLVKIDRQFSGLWYVQRSAEWFEEEE